MLRDEAQHARKCLGHTRLAVMRCCCFVVYISDNRSSVCVGLSECVDRMTDSIIYISHHIRSYQMNSGPELR